MPKTLKTLRALLRVVMRWKRHVEISESWLMILYQVLKPSWSLIQNIIINKIFEKYSSKYKSLSTNIFLMHNFYRFDFDPVFPSFLERSRKTDWLVITIGKGTFLQSQTPQPVTYVLRYSGGTLFPSRRENKHDYNLYLYNFSYRCSGIRTTKLGN